MRARTWGTRLCRLGLLWLGVAACGSGSIVIDEPDGDPVPDDDLPTATTRPDRAAVSSGGAATLAGAGYKLRLVVGEPIVSEELFDGERALRVGGGAKAPRER